MSFSWTFVVQYFVFQYHYICLSLSLLFQSSYTLVTSMQISIQYFIFRFQLLRLTSHIDITLLPFIALLYQILYIQTHYIIPVLPYLGAWGSVVVKALRY